MIRVIFHILPLVILGIFFTSSKSQNDPIIYSALSVALIFCSNKIANNEKKKNDIKPKLLAISYLLGYDFILSFTFGANALAFCITSLLYLKLRNKNNKILITKIFVEVLFVLTFYTIQQVINYFTNDVLNLRIIGVQLLFFMVVICTETYLNSPRNKDEIYFD